MYSHHIPSFLPLKLPPRTSPSYLPPNLTFFMDHHRRECGKNLRAGDGKGSCDRLSSGYNMLLCT